MENDLVLKRREIFSKIRVLNNQIAEVKKSKVPIDKAWNDKYIEKCMAEKNLLYAKVKELMPKEKSELIQSYLGAMRGNNESNEHNRIAGAIDTGNTDASGDTRQQDVSSDEDYCAAETDPTDH